MEKTYEFTVNFYDTYGSFDIEASSYDEAYSKAQDVICEAIKNLPVEVEYGVECIDEVEEE